LVQLSKPQSRVLVVFGASIVLVTFFVKDAWREQLKDVADALDTAQNQYVIRKDSLSLRLQLDALEVKVDEINARLPGSSGNVYKAEIFDQRLVLNHQLQSEIGLVQDSIEHLLEKSPSKSDSDKLGLLKDRLVSARAALKQVSFLLPRATGQADPDVDAGPPGFLHQGLGQTQSAAPVTALALIQAFAVYYPLRLVVFDLSKDTDALAAEVVNQVLEKKRKSENRYRCATVASYILYPIGWLVGLVGTLLGAEGVKVD